MMQRPNFDIQVDLVYEWDIFFINLCSFREVDTLINWKDLSYYRSHEAESFLSSWQFLS